MKIFKYTFIGFFVVISMMVFTQNDILAATATVNTSEVHQTIEGFGASLAWWYNSLYSHMAIYDISGREIKTLVEEIMPAGNHTVNVEVTGLSSGIYFYQLETGGKNIQKKMTLIR